MTAYSYEDISLKAGLTGDPPPLIPISPSLWCTWHTRYTPHTNNGPEERTPSSPEQVTDPSFSNEFCQSVFVRYFTMRFLGPFGLFPKVIKAGAGPHDLGPGDNAGDTLPELAVQPDPNPTDDIGVERGIVVRNTPNV